MSRRTQGLRSARIITAGLVAGSAALTAIGSVVLWDSTQDSTADAPSSTYDATSTVDSTGSPVSRSDGGVPHARSTGS